MPRSTIAIALAIYGVGVFGRFTQTLIARWDADLAFDTLIVTSAGNGLAWPLDLIRYIA